VRSPIKTILSPHDRAERSVPFGNERVILSAATIKSANTNKVSVLVNVVMFIRISIIKI